MGWRPTLALMEIIANRAARSARPLDGMVSAEDRLIISLLCDAAFGKARSHCPLCAFQVLRALGLVREAYDGDLPTLQLRQLFANACYDREAGEDKSKQLVMGEAHNIFCCIGAKPILSAGKATH